jgi:hypothetical protein
VAGLAEFTKIQQPQNFFISFTNSKLVNSEFLTCNQSLTSKNHVLFMKDIWVTRSTITFWSMMRETPEVYLAACKLKNVTLSHGFLGNNPGIREGCQHLFLEDLVVHDKLFYDNQCKSKGIPPNFHLPFFQSSSPFFPPPDIPP